MMHDMRGGAAQGQGRGAQSKPVVPMLHTTELAPFADALPIPFAARPGAGGKLRIGMQAVDVKVHRDVPPTRMWCYRDLNSGNAPGMAPLIEAQAGRPLQVEWVNQLPAKHFLPVDFTLHGCGRDVPEVRACVHLHGARARPEDDGQPEDWLVPGSSRTCNYPMQQEASTLWYHDHAMGLNRLNIYAGLFGMAIVRDRSEDALHLPLGRYEVPLIFFDRNFSTSGQLYYPESGDPDHPWVPEFNGDGLMVNGKIRPYFAVEPQPYRFRMLNASNSRFFALALAGNAPFHQIGSDQGLLSAPVQLTRLNLAPAERADVTIDFSAVAGQTVHLTHGGVGVLEFRVGRGSVRTAARSAPVPKALLPIARMPEATATLTRTVTLSEYPDQNGNTMLMLINRKRWHEPVTEKPKLGTTEIWEFVNLTEDTHPMHLHLVRFQVLDRRVFDVFAFRNSLPGNQGIRYLAPAALPEPNELGWKDTVQCPPGMVTRIIVRFEGYAGRYLYHCHILEHESNDMMRPFEVVG
jgi:spore coat protein A